MLTTVLSTLFATLLGDHHFAPRRTAGRDGLPGLRMRHQPGLGSGR